MKRKHWFLEKINKIDRRLVRLTEEKCEKTLITNIRNETKVTTTDPADIKRKKKRKPQLYMHKSDNLDKMDQLLEKCKLPPTHQIGNGSFE